MRGAVRGMPGGGGWQWGERDARSWYWGRSSTCGSTWCRIQSRAPCCCARKLGGICGTDLHNWQNGVESEVIMGHENVGIIDSLFDALNGDYRLGGETVVKIAVQGGGS